MPHPDASVHDTLTNIRGHAHDLVDGRATPYEAGLAIWKVAMSGVTGDGGLDDVHCHALWLLWGGLTDWVEVKPEESDEAERAMRRAASEWLAVADDESKWRPFFDHWLYEEVGYERPAP